MEGRGVSVWGTQRQMGGVDEGEALGLREGRVWGGGPGVHEGRGEMCDQRGFYMDERHPDYNGWKSLQCK